MRCCLWRLKLTRGNLDSSGANPRGSEPSHSRCLNSLIKNPTSSKTGDRTIFPLWSVNVSQMSCWLHVYKWIYKKRKRGGKIMYETTTIWPSVIILLLNGSTINKCLTQVNKLTQNKGVYEELPSVIAMASMLEDLGHGTDVTPSDLSLYDSALCRAGVRQGGWLRALTLVLLSICRHVQSVCVSWSTQSTLLLEIIQWVFSRQ